MEWPVHRGPFYDTFRLGVVEAITGCFGPFSAFWPPFVAVLLQAAERHAACRGYKPTAYLESNAIFFSVIELPARPSI